MKRISLTQSKFALVDDGDYEWLNQWKWYAAKRSGVYYAEHRVSNKLCPMHRELLGLEYGDHRKCDHIDGNGLNNQRFNLRIVTNQQNGFNQRPQRRATSSKFKGVCWDRQHRKWCSRIKRNGKSFGLGHYNNEEDAARAYDARAIILFGEYARLNFPKEVINVR